MATITQDMRYRLSLLKYAERFLTFLFKFHRPLMRWNLNKKVRYKNLLQLTIVFSSQKY